MKIRIEIGSATAASSRHPNEDRLSVGHDLWLLADGASFSSAPAEAASAAIAAAKEEMGRSGSIRHAVAAAHAAVTAVDGASTLMLVHHVEGTATVASVGDGSAYRLTQDEVLEHLIRAPQEDPAFLGVHSHPPVPVTTLVSLRPGDRLLVCTDGVHGALGDKAIAASLSQGTAQEAADALVGRAHRASDRDDDATAIVLDSIPDRSALVTAAALTHPHQASRDEADGADESDVTRPAPPIAGAGAGTRPSDPGRPRLTAAPVDVTPSTTAPRRPPAGPTDEPPRVGRWGRRGRGRRSERPAGMTQILAVVLSVVALALGVWLATRPDPGDGSTPAGVVQWQDRADEGARLVMDDDIVDERDYGCDAARILVAAASSAQFESTAAALTWFDTVNVASC